MFLAIIISGGFIIQRINGVMITIVVILFGVFFCLVGYSCTQVLGNNPWDPRVEDTKQDNECSECEVEEIEVEETEEGE
jgi:hypothetical protein